MNRQHQLHIVQVSLLQHHLVTILAEMYVIYVGRGVVMDTFSFSVTTGKDENQILKCTPCLVNISTRSTPTKNASSLATREGSPNREIRAAI